MTKLILGGIYDHDDMKTLIKNWLKKIKTYTPRGIKSKQKETEDRSAEPLEQQIVLACVKGGCITVEKLIYIMKECGAHKIDISRLIKNLHIPGFEQLNEHKIYEIIFDQLQDGMPLDEQAHWVDSCIEASFQRLRRHQPLQQETTTLFTENDFALIENELDSHLKNKVNNRYYTDAWYNLIKNHRIKNIYHIFLKTQVKNKLLTKVVTDFKNKKLPLQPFNENEPEHLVEWSQKELLKVLNDYKLNETELVDGKHLVFLMLAELNEDEFERPEKIHDKPLMEWLADQRKKHSYSNKAIADLQEKGLLDRKGKSRRDRK